MVVHIPTQFPFDSTKVVLYNYHVIVYVGNKPIVLKETSVMNIAEPSSMTHSGRVFHPDVSRKKAVKKVVEPPKGKDVIAELGEGPSKRNVTLENKKELLNTIKKCVYKVVDQLNQTPSKVSIMSLLMSSDARKTALMKYLNEAYVTEDISVNQFDNVVLI